MEIRIVASLNRRRTRQTSLYAPSLEGHSVTMTMKKYSTVTFWQTISKPVKTLPQHPNLTIHDLFQAHAAAIASMLLSISMASLELLHLSDSTTMCKIQTATALKTRGFAILGDGYMALVPKCAQMDDTVYPVMGRECAVCDPAYANFTTFPPYRRFVCAWN